MVKRYLRYQFFISYETEDKYAAVFVRTRRSVMPIGMIEKISKKLKEETKSKTINLQQLTLVPHVGPPKRKEMPRANCSIRARRALHATHRCR